MVSHGFSSLKCTQQNLYFGVIWLLVAFVVLEIRSPLNFKLLIDSISLFYFIKIKGIFRSKTYLIITDRGFNLSNYFKGYELYKINRCTNLFVFSHFMQDKNQRALVKRKTCGYGRCYDCRTRGFFK